MLTIHNWQAFESNAAKRRPERGMAWYCMKANLNTRGRLALTRHGIKGLAAIAVFEGCVKYAASLPLEQRGTLVWGDGSAVSIEDLSQILSISVDILRGSVKLLLDVGWLIDQTGSFLINNDQQRSNLIKNDARREEKRGEEKRGEENRRQTGLTEYPKPFVEFWSFYPRKVNKKAALKAWDKATKETPAEQIIGAAEIYAASDIAADGEFVPHPATWLNKGGYLDDPAEWERRESKSKEQKRQEKNFNVLADVSQMIEEQERRQNGQSNIHATNGNYTKRISHATKQRGQF
jgi:hypothetical protein